MKRLPTTAAKAATAYRLARAHLEIMKAIELPFGKPVQVSHERYQGPGTLARLAGAPDTAAVTLPNGNTHFYPVECLTPL